MAGTTPSHRKVARPPFIRTSIPCSALRRRAGAIRTSRRNANSCFPPYPAHEPQDAIGKEGDSLNSSPKFTKLHNVKTPRKNAKSQLALAVAQETSIEKQDCQKRRIWLVDGPFQSPDQGRESAGRREQQSRGSTTTCHRLTSCDVSPRNSARTAFTSHSPRPAKPDSSRSTRGGVPIGRSGFAAGWREPLWVARTDREEIVHRRILI